MKLAREVSLFVWLLRSAVLLFGLAAVWLFSRMSPAIEHILADNVASLEATETLLATLAWPERPGAAGRFEAALEVVIENRTEEAEGPLITQLREALDGREGEELLTVDRAKVVALLLELGEVNRASMESADREARRLGTAGAWSVVVLGLLILGASQGFAARLERKVVSPLLGVVRAVRAARDGDRHRRCPVEPMSAVEIRAIATGLNAVLDEAPLPSQRRLS